MAGLSTVSESRVLKKQGEKSQTENLRDASGLSVDRSTFHKSLCRNGLSGRQAFKEGKQGEKPSCAKLHKNLKSEATGLMET